MAIELGDALDLTKFPGIGANSSHQTILDLKGKQVTEDLSELDATRRMLLTLIDDLNSDKIKSFY